MGPPHSVSSNLPEPTTPRSGWFFVPSNLLGAGDAVESGGDDAPGVAGALAGGEEAGDADVLEGLRVAGETHRG